MLPCFPTAFTSQSFGSFNGFNSQQGLAPGILESMKWTLWALGTLLLSSKQVHLLCHPSRLTFIMEHPELIIARVISYHLADILDAAADPPT